MQAVVQRRDGERARQHVGAPGDEPSQGGAEEGPQRRAAVCWLHRVPQPERDGHEHQRAQPRRLWRSEESAPERKLFGDERHGRVGDQEENERRDEPRRSGRPQQRDDRRLRQERRTRCRRVGRRRRVPMPQRTLARGGDGGAPRRGAGQQRDRGRAVVVPDSGESRRIVVEQQSGGAHRADREAARHVGHQTRRPRRPPAEPEWQTGGEQRHEGARPRREGNRGPPRETLDQGETRQAPRRDHEGCGERDARAG